MSVFDPMTVDEHRDRFDKMLETTYDAESVALGLAAAPGATPECRFDFKGGLRMIVSKVRHTDGKLMLHISASAWPGSLLYNDIKNGVLPPAAFLDLVMVAYAHITSLVSVVKFLGFSEDKLVPHWYVELDS